MKKRLLLLSVATVFLLTSCDGINIITGGNPTSPTKTTDNSANSITINTTASPKDTTENTEQTAEPPEETTVTEPETTVPEVIPPTFTESEIEAGYLYLSGKEQFVVSKKKNIITFILDAADNVYIENLMNNKPEVFSGFEDFTVYTNTCSVFDSTFQSVTQMYSGYTALPTYKISEWNKDAWGSQAACEFFDRFHKAGYKMNFYVNAELQFSRLVGKFDNLALSEEKLYERDYYHSNSGFDGQLETMSLAEDEYNRFNVIHLAGAHDIAEGLNSFEEQMEYLFGIVRKYLDKLKEFGVYDDSTIIITADHGTHNIYKHPNATPMFMIKEAGKKSDTLKTNSSPIYWTDFIPTYLVNAGLFDEKTDKSLFGSSIYDFNENSVRERVSNFRMYSDRYPESAKSPLVPNYGYNVIYSFKYTGDSKALLEVAGKYDGEVTWMEESAA